MHSVRRMFPAKLKQCLTDGQLCLAQLDFLWRPVTYEYGTGVVPNKGEGWPSFAGGEGEVRLLMCRRLLAVPVHQGNYLHPCLACNVRNCQLGLHASRTLRMPDD